MPALRKRLSRYLTDSRLPEPIFCSVTDFYREEFVKCQRCLDKQREFYSEHAIRDMECPNWIGCAPKRMPTRSSADSSDSSTW